MKRINTILEYIKLDMYRRENKALVSLHKALRRPHLEYDMQFWPPMFKKRLTEYETKFKEGTVGWLKGWRP